ncbi:hypothetical protein COO60DRAFT_1282853 [Scenedesmus sp. NREL 46B-D3]|nr:hypothetical protein COO60DRAFT_1282853 [Scenedesmus sp. NREL 46B-D3]
MIAAKMQTSSAKLAGARIAPRLAAPRASRASTVRVSAVASTDKPEVAKFADSIGLPTEEGLFGFRPFAEQWCGRLAMMGFVVSIVEEAMTGRGTLAQIGFDTPNPATLALLCAVFGTATLVGTADTVRKLVTRKMTPRDIARYKNFLGLDNPNDFMAAAAEMKKKGDFTSLGSDAAAINAVRSQGMAADKVLGLNDAADADQTAREMKAADGSVLTLNKADEARQVASAASDMKASPTTPAGPSMSLAARSDVVEQVYFNEKAELAYARGVELTNGRYAMLGFLAAVLVEAATGKGIILQIIMYLKLSGLLGAASGF